MKAFNIKSSLTIRFILIFGVIWSVALVIVYFASSYYRQEEFYRRLYGRAETIARLLVDVEQVDAKLLREIEAASPVQLTYEEISVFDYEDEEIFTTDLTDTIRISREVINEIRLLEELRWTQFPGDFEILGILYKGNYDRYVVIAGAQDVYGIRKLQNLRNILVMVFFSSLIIAGFVGRNYAGKALEPMSEVIEEVNQIDSRQLHTRVSEGNRHDEIAVLGITFNRMLDRIQAAFESQKSFIANSSHELRTPMTSMLSQIDLTLLKERDSETYQKALMSVKEDILKLSDLTSKLLLITKLDTFNLPLVLLRTDSAIWQTISDLKNFYSDFKVVVNIDEAIDDEKRLQIRGSEQLFRSMCYNLMENAFKYSGHGDVIVNLSTTGSNLVIAFTDHGIGIPEPELEKIGEPFFRASNTASYKGSGVGLNLVRRIVQIHNGDFRINSSLGKGTTVTTKFPLADF